MDSLQKRNSLIRRATAVALGGVGASLMVVAPVGAAPLITVNVDNVAYGEEGDLIPVGSAAVPVDAIGQTCLIKAESINQESVHANNNLIIVSGDQTFVIPDVEGLANQFTEVEEFEEIAAEINVFIELGPDGVTSGGFVITVDCTVQPPTPTTIAPPTTVAPPTTGELNPEGGGEIIDSPTTTAPPPAGPEVTQAPATPTTAPAPAGPTLPVTGSSIGIFAFSGLWLLAAGLFLQRAAVARLSR